MVEKKMNEEDFVEEIEEYSKLKGIIIRLLVLVVSVVLIFTIIFQPRFFTFLT